MYFVCRRNFTAVPFNAGVLNDHDDDPAPWRTRTRAKSPRPKSLIRAWIGAPRRRQFTSDGSLNSRKKTRVTGSTPLQLFLV